MVKKLLLLFIIQISVAYGVGNKTDAMCVSKSDLKNGIFIKTNLSKTKPYQYEPFIYTIKLYSKHAANNIQLEPLNIEDSYVKSIEFNKVYTEQKNGIVFNVAECSYMITPLSANMVTIPSLKISGISLLNKYQTVGGFFQSEYEQPKSQVDLDQKEFVLKSEEFKIEVLPPVGEVSPWIPAKRLSVSENLEMKQYKIGESITRVITINAEGIRSNQLPDISKNLPNSDDYKIYAEAPKADENIKNGKITSSKEYTYSIISQKTGKIILPSVEIKWWDVNNSKFVNSTIPARSIEIKGVANAANLKPTNESPSLASESENWQGKYIYILFLVGVIASISFIYALYKIYLHKYSKNNVMDSRQLEQISTIKEYLKFLQAYSYNNFNTPINSSLAIVFTTLKNNSPEPNQALLDHMQKMLEDALYGNKHIDTKQIAKKCNQLLLMIKVKRPRKKIKKPNDLPNLNPDV